MPPRSPGPLDPPPRDRAPQRASTPRGHDARPTSPPNAAPPPDRRGRGPLLLFAAGALIALMVAAAQLLHLPVPGAQYLPGGRGSAAASDARRPAAAGDGTTITDLNKLREQYGDPEQANYGRMRIPAIDVDAPLSRSVVGADGQLADPLGPSDVVWYDFGGRTDVGGAPGAGGNAVFAGHVDRNGYVDYAGVNYSGPGILFWLDRLEPGDVVEVTTGGKTLRYAVVWSKQVPADADWNQLFSSDVLGDSITIVTCGGEFDYDRQEYTSRLVVRAVRG